MIPLTVNEWMASHVTRRSSTRDLGCVVIAFAFFVRVVGLTHQSLWPDEAYSIVTSHWDAAQLVDGLRADNVPLYSVLLGSWQLLTGSTEFSLRFLSVGSSILSVALVITLGRRLFGLTIGLVAAALTAISPFQLYYAQEVRMYSLLGLLGLLASWFFIRWFSAPPRWIVFLQAGLLGLMFYTHYAGFFVVGAHVAAVLLTKLVTQGRSSSVEPGPDARWPTATWHWAWAWLGGILLFLPWVALHLASLEGVAQSGSSTPIFRLISSLLIDVTFGSAGRLDAGQPDDALVLTNMSRASLLLLVPLVLLVWPHVKHRRVYLSWERSMVVLQVLVPFGALLVLVQFARGFATRYAFPGTSWIPIAVVAGLSMLRAPLRWLGVGGIVLYSLYGSFLYDVHPRFERLPFRDAVDTIAAHRMDGDSVVLAPDVAATYGYYASTDHLGLPNVVVPETGVADDASVAAALAPVGERSGRLWVIRWQDYYYDPHSAINHWLTQHALPVMNQDLGGGLNISLWLTTPPVVPALPSNVVRVNEQLSTSLRLVGYQVTREQAAVLTVTFFWQPEDLLTDDYTVFVHVLDQQGQPVTQRDSRPFDGHFPTGSWPVGGIVHDVHQIPIGPCIPVGRYNLETGLYVLKTMKRLGAPPKDQIRLSFDLPSYAPRNQALRWLNLLPPSLRIDSALSGRTCLETWPGR